MTTVSIVGGTGFLGSRLARAWADDGATVTVTSRSAWAAPPSVRHVRWDPAREPVPTAVSSAEVVYNLAGENIGASRWSAQKRSSLYASRVDTTRRLVESLGPSTRVLVNASAISAYPGDGREHDEGAPLAAGPDASFIQRMTMDWEQAAARAAGDRRVVIARIGMVLGSEGMLAGMLPLFRARVARYVGWRDAAVPWIDVHDTIRMLRFIAQDERIRGPINVTGPAPVSFESFSSCVQRELGVTSYVGLPSWLVRLVLGRDAAALVLARHVIVPHKAVTLGFRFEVPDLVTSVGRALDQMRAR